jgi:diphthine synthase
MGLGSGKGLSIAALEALKNVDTVFVESYTGLVTEDSLQKLENIIGKDLKCVDRKMVEEGTELLDKVASNRATAILTVGDPMSATTHIDLRLRAHDLGLSTRLIHGTSIFTAAPGLVGLQQYKFGRTTTLSFPQEKYFPESPYDIIGENLNSGLHTLILLELTTDENRIMTASDGIKVLIELESRKKKGYITDGTLLCIIARAGSESARVKAGWVKDLKIEDFGEPMHCLIVPGKLHFKEAEALVKFCSAPKEILEGVD